MRFSLLGILLVLSSLQEFHQHSTENVGIQPKRRRNREADSKIETEQYNENPRPMSVQKGRHEILLKGTKKNNAVEAKTGRYKNKLHAQKAQMEKPQRQENQEQSETDQQNTEDDNSIWRFNINVPAVLNGIKAFTGISIKGNGSEKTLRARADDPWSKVYTIEMKPDLDRMMSYVKNMFNINSRRKEPSRRDHRRQDTEDKIPERYVNPKYFNFYPGNSYVEEGPGIVKAFEIKYPPKFYANQIMNLMAIQARRKKKKAKEEANREKENSNATTTTNPNKD